jgi:putative FmdB family regulatory protein
VPLFEYKCSDCNHEFEELVSSSSQEINCPKCKSKNVTKLLSVFSSSVNNGSAASCEQRGCGSGFG